MSDNQKFFLSFLLICFFSLTMHAFLVRRGALQQYRSQPGVPAASPSEFGSVQGTVSALGFDRFHLQGGAGRWTFLVGTLPLPAVGSRVTVRFQKGDPPRALEITQTVEGSR